MKNLKYLSIAAMLFFGFNSVNAQTLTSEKASFQKENRHNKLQKELDLSEEQVKEIKTIRAKRAEEKKKLHNEMQRLRQEEKKEIQTVYTPEQKERLNELRSNRKGKMKDHQGKRNMKGKKMQHRKRK